MGKGNKILIQIDAIIQINHELENKMYLSFGLEGEGLLAEDISVLGGGTSRVGRDKVRESSWVRRGRLAVVVLRLKSFLKSDDLEQKKLDKLA